MIVIVDECDTVKDGDTAWFDREGVLAGVPGLPDLSAILRRFMMSVRAAW